MELNINLRKISCFRKSEAPAVCKVIENWRHTLSAMPLHRCEFSPLSEIPGSIELLENSLTYEGVQWRKIVECLYTNNVICLLP